MLWEPAYCDYFELGHIEIVTEYRKAIPITKTGYRSHFCDARYVIENGGPVAYVKKRLELEEGSKARKAYMAESKAMTLF